MTDNEIINTLECCGDTDACNGCPLKDMKYFVECTQKMAKCALDLINRQKAEIERLEKEVQRNYNIRDKAYRMMEDIEKKLPLYFSAAISEAIKEFAERLKKRLERKYTVYGREYVLRHLRDLVKEMT